MAVKMEAVNCWLLAARLIVVRGFKILGFVEWKNVIALAMWRHSLFFQPLTRAE
jgi:hypothetical protein